MLSKLLPFVLLLVLLVVVSYFLFPELNLESNSNTSIGFNEENSEKKCELGNEIECTTDLGCKGKNYCTSNGWTDCTVSKICTPNSKKKCMDGCLNGYETCNECGTVYGSCLGESTSE